MNQRLEIKITLLAILLSIGILIPGFADAHHADRILTNLQYQITRLTNEIAADQQYLQDNPNADDKITVQRRLDNKTKELKKVTDQANEIIRVDQDARTLEERDAAARAERETAEARSREATRIANQATASAAADSCGLRNLSACIPAAIRWAIRAIGVFFQQIFGSILWLVGKFFDASVSYSILDFSDVAKESVQAAWTILRDLANVFFIFILLYIAIGMILQLQNINGRRMLVSVIIVALLINFSAFFTRIVIDASNVVAVQFYNALAKNETSSIAGLSIGGIAAPFMNKLPIASALANKTLDGYFGGEKIIKRATISFGVVIMMIVTIFVFLTAAILFVIRTVTLIFLIILSPLAFLMYAFPNQEGLFKKWWSTLFNQAFFAPLYLIMVYVTLKILGSDAITKIAADSGSSPIKITIHFAIAAGFMFGAIIIAKNLGAKGASAAMKGAGALTGAAAGAVKWGGRQTGRLGVAGAARLAGTITSGARSTQLKQFAGIQWKNVKTDAGTALKQQRITKGIKEFAKAPLKTTAEGLAAVTKDFGVSGILGRTKDEEAEARKREKERKEAENKAELKKKEDQLRGNPQNASSIVADIKDKDISDIDSKVLVQHGQYLRASQLAESIKHLNHTDRTAIKNKMMTAVGSTQTPTGGWTPPTTGTAEQKQAWDWLVNNNAGKIF